MYRVKVTIEVVDEEGNEVDCHGRLPIAGRKQVMLHVEQYFREYDGIADAHHAMTNLFYSMQALSKVK